MKKTKDILTIIVSLLAIFTFITGLANLQGILGWFGGRSIDSPPPRPSAPTTTSSTPAPAAHPDPVSAAPARPPAQGEPPRPQPVPAAQPGRPPAAKPTTRVSEVLPSGLTIPETVLEAGEQVARVAQRAGTNACRSVWVALEESRAFSEAFHGFCVGLAAAARQHLSDAHARFRSRRPGEASSEYETWLRGADKTAYQEALEAIRMVTQRYGVPTLHWENRNKTATFGGPAWGLAVRTTLVPKSHSGKSLYWDLAYRPLCAGEGANFFARLERYGPFDGLIDPVRGGRLTTKNVSAGDAEAFLDHPQAGKLDYLIVPFLELHLDPQFFRLNSSYTKFLLARVRFTWTGAPRRLFFDACCFDSVTYDYPWVDALKEAQLPRWLETADAP